MPPRSISSIRRLMRAALNPLLPGIRARAARSRIRLAATILSAGAMAPFAAIAAEEASVADAPGEATFATHAMPVLQRYCSGCHNAVDWEGDLSVETFSELMEGGESGPAVIPGDPAGSLLAQVVRKSADPHMPPKDEPQPPEEAVRRLEAWIAAGAPPPPAGQEDRPILLVPKIEPAEVHASPVTAVAFSPAGDRLAVGRFREVAIHDAATMRPLARLDGVPGKVAAIHFAESGEGDDRRQLLVAASGIAGVSGEALVWDLSADGGHAGPRSFGGRAHRDLLFDAELSPDGRHLATAGYDRVIHLWDLESGNFVRSIEGHNGAVYDLAFSPDGSVLASASADETVKLWNVATGERLDTLNQPLKEQLAVAFSPDGEFIVCAGADNRIRVYRFTSRGQPSTNPIVHSVFAHERAVTAIALSSDGRWLVSAAEDRTLSLWTFPGVQPARDFGAQSDVPAALAIAPEGGIFMAAMLDGSVESFALAPSLVAAGPDGDAAGTPVAPGEAAAGGGGDGDAGDSLAEVAEAEESVGSPGDGGRAEVQSIPVPSRVSGTIGFPGDSDCFRFSAARGRALVIEVVAARLDPSSPLDSRIEVLDSSGSPVERVVLQAVRDSWFTFRGKDSTTSDDFRLHNWEEMELNEFLYANGEVVKLWLYPRGPDSGFKVYPGFGNRFTYFGTTARTHALGEPCYIVRPFPSGAVPPPNGLPVFRVHYENDDDSRRRWERDSFLIFDPPADGEFEVRVSDVRGFGGEAFAYALTVRAARPGFDVRIEGADPTVAEGSGREFSLRVNRHDGFEGEIAVVADGVPPGWHVTSPIVIEAGQEVAVGSVHAMSGAAEPGAEASGRLRLTAQAEIGGRKVVKELGSLGELKLGPPPKVLAEILPADPAAERDWSPDQPYAFSIQPGETISARVRIRRADGFNDRVSFGNEDSGRNFAHGTYVDNIGLNGLLIVEGQDEREFFITAAKWVPSGSRLVHLKADVDGGQCAWPVILTVVDRSQAAR